MGPKRYGKNIVIIADIKGPGQDYHIGDEAMAEVAIERLKHIVNPSQIYLIAPIKRKAAEYYGVRNIYFQNLTPGKRLKKLIISPVKTIWQIARAIWAIQRANAVFVCGGGNITSVWPGVLNTRLMFLRISFFLGKPVVMASQTIGPFHEQDREKTLKILLKADWIGVRDRNISNSYPEIVTSFAPDDAVFIKPEHSAVTKKLVQTYPRMVGISLRGSSGSVSEELKDLLIATKDTVRNLDATGVFLPHIVGKQGGDLRTASRLREIWDSNRQPLIILDRALSAREALALSAEFKLIIASRYHEVIFGLASGVPTVAIYLNPYTEAKMRGAYEQFDLDPFTIDIKNVHEKLQPMAEKAVRAREVFVRAAEYVKREKYWANLQPYERVKNILNRD